MRASNFISILLSSATTTVQSFITQPLKPPLIRRKSNAAGIMKKMSGGNVINDNTNEMMELNPLVSSIKISVSVRNFLH